MEDNKVNKGMYVLIGILLISGLFLLWFIMTSVKEMRVIRDEDKKIVFEDDFGTNSMKSIIIDLVSFDLEIYESEDSLAHIKVYDRSDKYIKRSMSGDSYIFKEKERTDFLPSVLTSGAKVLLYIPNGYGNELRIDTVNGNVYNQALLVADANISTINGNLVLGNISSLKLNVVNGSVSINKANKLDITTSSADVSINDCVIDTIKSVSGNIEIKKAFVQGNGVIETNSGNVIIEELKDGYVDASSIKGAIEVKNKYGKSPNNLYVKTVSGDIVANK